MPGLAEDPVAGAAPSHPAAAAAAPKGASHVYVFKGFMNVFSPGMDTLVESLKKRGVRASVHSHTEWSSLAETAIQNYKNGRERAIVIVGHSMGAGAAVYMAEKLGESKIPVRLVVTFDPVSKLAISPNVQRSYNFYVSNGMGTSTERAEKSRGALTNVDRQNLGHVSITTAPDIQRKVLGYVMGALGGGGVQPATTGHAAGDMRKASAPQSVSGTAQSPQSSQ